MKKPVFALVLMTFAPWVPAYADDATTTPDTIATTTIPDTATMTLRDNGTLIGPFTVTLPDVSAPLVPLSATGDSTSHNVPARSVLAALAAQDASSTDFDITNLQYFDSFGSFIINCISVPAASSTPDCYNWTYAVNGSFPSVGMDAYTLQNGERADIFFGSQWHVSTDKSSVVTDEPFTVTAQEYDAPTGNYVPAVGETVGAVQFDANFTPTEFATSTTDASGHATLSLANAGTYAVGIASSGYFPNTSVTVSTSTPVAPPPPSGGSGTSHTRLDVPTALSYLTGQQHADGSFDSPFLSDWAALAFASADPGSAKIKLHQYLLGASPSLSSVTDYERHAMALEALGIDPYSGANADYIAPILQAFDGTQIGDPSLDNDDIFALFPLLHAGYDASDAVIQKTTAFILLRQGTDGSWDESVDVTAAAVQALAHMDSLPNVSAALTKAEGYLHAEQQTDGGFGNSFSTSWALQAIASLHESPASYTRAGFTPQDYLATLQQTDGGVEPTSSSAQTRVWATEYAIPASLLKPWDSLLQSFTKPSVGDGSAVSPLPTNATATSTPASNATSTLTFASVSTTTPPAVERVKPKKVVPALRTASALVSTSSSSLAAVGAAPTAGFFSHLWNVLVSFFRNLL